MREIQTMFDGPMYLISPKRKRIIDVMCEALETGDILSNQQLAERAGVSEKTIQRFLKDEAHGGVLQAYLNYMVEANLVEIFAALIRRAKTGSSKSQELLFRTIGLLKENKTDLIQVFNIDNKQQVFFSDADIDQMLQGYSGTKGLKP